ncbi:MAG: S4 domain-containing protein, partial [Gammaproteobacteria bacterium]
MPDKSAAVRHREVLADEAGQRIDNFLVRELKGVPKGHVYRLLRTGQVRVNRGRVKPHYRLQAGDSVRLPPVRTTPPTSAKPSRELTDRLEAAVIFEDRRLLAVNKPAGLAVHGGSGLSLGVIEALRQARPDAPYLE